MRQVVHAVLLLLIVCRLVDADVPDWDYEPNGASAKLYRPGVDKVIQLDEETFEDTVFNSSVPVLVELYKDWCGYCRRFLPVYREFAWSVQNWKDVVKIAAINCADIHNSRVCGKAFQYGKKTVPTVKFFPPNASEYSDLKEFDPEQTVEAIRYSLVTELNNCCDLNSTLPDEGGLLNDVKDASSIWSTVPSDVSYAALVYDEDETNRSTAAEILALDLLPYKDKIAVLPTTSLSTLTNRPSTNGAEQTVALFKRGSDKPVFQLTLSPNASTEIIQNTDLDPVGSQALDVEELQSTADVVNCTEEQEKCAKMYFVSESDMLKAMRTVLYDEMMARGVVEGEAFDDIKGFVELLANHFPTETRQRNLFNRAQTQLSRSAEVRPVFHDLKDFLNNKSRRDAQSFTVDEWNSTFLKSEERHGFPFPAEDTEWEHCKGTSIEFRGFTCGLWTTFHALTVRYYLANQDGNTDASDGKESDAALVPLKAIQGWIRSFFGCESCRQHFMKLSTQEFPMDESNVKRAEDSFLYLWKAHNRVNQRLQGDMTEDPQFVKYQFPPEFLCPECRRNDSSFEEERVKEFLVEYYTDIRPSRTTAGSSGAIRRHIYLSTIAVVTLFLYR